MIAVDYLTTVRDRLDEQGYDFTTGPDHDELQDCIVWQSGNTVVYDCAILYGVNIGGVNISVDHTGSIVINHYKSDTLLGIKVQRLVLTHIYGERYRNADDSYMLSLKLTAGKINQLKRLLGGRFEMV